MLPIFPQKVKQQVFDIFCKVWGLFGTIVLYNCVSNCQQKFIVCEIQIAFGIANQMWQ